MMEGF